MTRLEALLVDLDRTNARIDADLAEAATVCPERMPELGALLAQDKPTLDALRAAQDPADYQQILATIRQAEAVAS